ncbi:recombinase family protein [Pseudoxanthomonas sp. F11]|uniref:recombinase family protein n=1 Tax=Pseudoxanthomonas sp. F11 TaxID=3126308 RepID=UPI00300CB2C0
MTAFIGYYRVSTQAQGRSGLGLEAQRDAVCRYVSSVGGKLLAEFQEVESGKGSDRPQLKAALQQCRAQKAMLVIAKLDRLARNVHFISQLLESGIEFIAADMPSANKLTIHIIAAMAEYERDVVSQRTKASLAAARSRGVLLGNPRAAEVSALGVASAQASADEYALALKPTLDSLRASGITSYARLAAALEASRVRTQRGGRWSAAGVKNILSRLEKLGKGRLHRD